MIKIDRPPMPIPNVAPSQIFRYVQQPSTWSPFGH